MERKEEMEDPGRQHVGEMLGAKEVRTPDNNKPFHDMLSHTYLRPSGLKATLATWPGICSAAAMPMRLYSRGTRQKYLQWCMVVV